MNDLKQKDLLNLPIRKWYEVKSYSSLLILPTGKKHSSGWRLMAIIGCEGRKPIEIAGYCDDINWIVEENFRTDMPYKSRVCHLWGPRVRFEVGINCSSTDIRVFKNDTE